MMHYYLGLEVGSGLNEIYLGQRRRVIEILKKFDMMEYKTMTTLMITNLRRLRSYESSPMDPSRYKQLIVSLMYLVNTRPDICFVVNILSQFQVDSKHDNWISVKHILTYLRGIINYYLKYDRRNDVQFIGYTNSDWGGNEQYGIRTRGRCFSLGSSTVSWIIRKRDIISLISVEAEYVATCEVSREVVWLRKLLPDVFEGPIKPTVILGNNTSSICLSEALVFHGKTKQINNKYHYIPKLVKNLVLQLQYISTKEISQEETNW